MALKLNATREAYQEFYGRNVEQMLKLIADGRVPMNVSQFMQRRIDVRNSDKAVKGSYMDNYFYTGDAVVYHPDGRVKIVLDSQTLRDMTPESQRVGGALIIGEDVYNTLEGEEFKKEKLGKTESPLSREDVKAHPVWKVLARNQALLNDYTDYIFAEGKERFSYDTAMGVYLDSAGNDVKMRAWYVGRLVGMSVAIGRDRLDLDDGRFVGIAPEALSASGKDASSVQRDIMADLQTFDKSINRLEETVRPKFVDKAIKGLEVTVRPEL